LRQYLGGGNKNKYMLLHARIIGDADYARLENAKMKTTDICRDGTYDHRQLNKIY